MKECLAEARRRRKAGTLALCPRGVLQGQGGLRRQVVRVRERLREPVLPEARHGPAGEPAEPLALVRRGVDRRVPVHVETGRDRRQACPLRPCAQGGPPVPVLPPLPAHQQEDPRHGRGSGGPPRRRGDPPALPRQAGRAPPHYRPARSQSPARRRFSRRRAAGRRKP